MLGSLSRVHARFGHHHRWHIDGIDGRAIGRGAHAIYALRDDAELLDQIVEHAMKVREERPWRLPPGE